MDKLVQEMGKRISARRKEPPLDARRVGGESRADKPDNFHR